MTIVSESGLYSLVLGSRKPEAKAFKRWVTHDVLPSIRWEVSYERGKIRTGVLGKMAEHMEIFESSEFGRIGVIEKDGKPYFPATKCARVLGHENPQRAIRKYCKGVTELVTPTDGGKQVIGYIPEGDLYRLIISSKMPSAERFECWVFDDVLPSIRKRGLYVTDEVLSDSKKLADALDELSKERALRLDAEGKLALIAQKNADKILKQKATNKATRDSESLPYGKVIIAMVHAISTRAYGGDYKHGANAFYKNAQMRCGIDLYNRRDNWMASHVDGNCPKLYQFIRADEADFVISETVKYYASLGVDLSGIARKAS